MKVATVTTSDLGLLNAIRGMLRGAESAYLCVAFAHARGVRLLGRELEDMQARRARARLLVTTVFDRDGQCSGALAAASTLGVEVRIHNRAKGTFHPKLYLADAGGESQAVISSANLTGGLVSNLEIGVALRGTRSEPAIVDAWSWGEELWADALTNAWVPIAAEAPAETLAPDLLTALGRLEGRTIRTLADDSPNTIVRVDESGVLVETEESRRKRSGPQLVDAWMLNDAWAHLRERGDLTNQLLLKGLRIMRSSAVCAMLAHVPGVRVVSRRPIFLRLDRMGPTR